MEEERRLCYVAITRAKQTLCLSFADQRMLYGHTNTNRVSRFVEEIPENLVEKLGSMRPPVNDYSYRARPGYGTSYPRSSSPQRPQWTPPAEKKQAPLPELKPGSMVEHKSFGKGMVISALKMGNDALLEIAFDAVGTKRLMAKTALAHMKVL